MDDAKKMANVQSFMLEAYNHYKPLAIFEGETPSFASTASVSHTFEQVLDDLKQHRHWDLPDALG